MLRNSVSILLSLALLLNFTAVRAAHHNKTPLEVQRLQQKAAQRYSVLPKQSSTATVKFMKNRAKPSAHLLRGVVLPGSLKENIQRLAREQGWRDVVWNAPADYRWLGRTRIAARTLPDLLSKLLANYPLQAVFYRGNHILVINPRTIQ